MRRRRRRRGHDRLSRMLISIVVIVLLVGLTIQSQQMKEKNEAYAQQIAALDAQIESENQRSEEIDAMQEYMTTDEFVESVARDRLGLVYEGDTIFKPAE